MLLLKLYCRIALFALPCKFRLQKTHPLTPQAAICIHMDRVIIHINNTTINIDVFGTIVRTPTNQTTSRFLTQAAPYPPSQRPIPLVLQTEQHMTEKADSPKMKIGRGSQAPVIRAEVGNSIAVDDLAKSLVVEGTSTHESELPVGLSESLSELGTKQECKTRVVTKGASPEQKAVTNSTKAANAPFVRVASTTALKPHIALNVDPETGHAYTFMKFSEGEVDTLKLRERLRIFGDIVDLIVNNHNLKEARFTPPFPPSFPLTDILLGLGHSCISHVLRVHLCAGCYSACDRKYSRSHCE
jgi:hypothetical protein